MVSLALNEKQGRSKRDILKKNNYNQASAMTNRGNEATEGETSNQQSSKRTQRFQIKWIGIYFERKSLLPLPHQMLIEVRLAFRVNSTIETDAHAVERLYL